MTAEPDDTNGQNIGQAHLFDAVSGNLLHTFDDPTITVPSANGSTYRTRTAILRAATAKATRLTSRELEVCQLLFRGRMRQQIASVMGISPRTVRQHLEQIHGKPAVKYRVELVVRIIQIRDTLNGHVPALTACLGDVY